MKRESRLRQRMQPSFPKQQVEEQSRGFILRENKLPKGYERSQSSGSPIEYADTGKIQGRVFSLQERQDIEKRIIKQYLDIIILKIVKEKAISGYAMTTCIYKRFHVTLSSSTIYAELYSLERKGLIKGKRTFRSRSYVLTNKGLAILRLFIAMREDILLLSNCILFE